MEDEAKFRIKGCVSRRTIVSPKFAALVVETSQDGRRAYHDIVFFGESMVGLLDTVGVGEEVDIAGKIGSKKVTNRDGTDVVRDGQYTVRTAQLVAVRFQASNPRQQDLPQSKPAQSRQPEQDPLEDDQIPF